VKLLPMTIFIRTAAAPTGLIGSIVMLELTLRSLLDCPLFPTERRVSSTVSNERTVIEVQQYVSFNAKYRTLNFKPTRKF
jgi:hypothetical protein